MKSNMDYVILVHGFWRTSKSMKKLERSLREDGFDVINIDYPSRKEKIEYLANDCLKKIIEKKCVDAKKKINFVTHSMGGVIVRYFLANNKLANLGRVVMLAPLNKGTKLADKLSGLPFSDYIFGRSPKQLTTRSDSLLNCMPQPDYEVGVIAAKYDDKIPVEDTKLPGMKDFLLVPRTHTYIMNSDEVIKAVKNFLRCGRFKKTNYPNQPV